MNKQELINKMADATNMSKKDSATALNAFLDIVQKEMSTGNAVQILGFGTFEVRERAARKGLNPLTKAPIDIPACKVPAFKAGKALKDAVK